MIHNIYMLFDNVSQMYIGAMTLLVNDAVAIRSFYELSKSSQFPYVNMLDDLNLYRIGTFDSATGVITSKKELICNLGNLKLNKDMQKEKKDEV